MMWSSLGVFNLAVLIYKVFSITEFFLLAVIGPSTWESCSIDPRYLERGHVCVRFRLMKLQIMKLPTQHLLNENLEFINTRTCLVLERKWGGCWEKIGTRVVTMNIIYEAIWIQGKAIWNLIKFSSLLLLCKHGWVASGESSIKTQVHGEVVTRKRPVTKSLP